MKKKLAFGTLGEMLVLAHAEEPPTDAEWNAYIEAWDVHHSVNARSRLLVSTAGGTPTAGQRHRLDERLRRYGLDTARAAILSESAFARVVTNALSAMEHARARGPLGGFGDDPGPASSRIYRIFARSDLRQALLWLDVSPAREPEVVRYLEQLHAAIANSG